MTSAVDKWPAAARLGRSRRTSHLPTAPTPRDGTRPLLKIDAAEPRVLNGLAWFRATAAEARFRNGREAVRLARQAIEIRDETSFRDTLAAALAETGEFDQALRVQTEATQIVRERYPEDVVVRHYEKRLELYRKRQAVRCPGEYCD
jgi:hypothetical protein